MWLCEICQTEMIENLYLRSELHGESIRLGKQLPKQITVKAAVCPKCGRVELYTEDLENVRKLSQ